MRNLVAVIVLWIGSNAYGAYGDGVAGLLNKDLLSCQVNSTYLRSKCSLPTRAFLSRSSFKNHQGKTQNVGVRVTVDYTFACEGHAMKVGVSSGQETEEFQFGGTREVLEGSGPFQVQSFSPGQSGATFKASISAGCKLVVRRVHWDLNGSSQQRLTQWVSTTKDLARADGLVSKVDDTLKALQSTLGALDSAGIQAVLGAVKAEAKSLEAQTTNEVVLDALADAIDEMEILIALNPAAIDAGEMRDRAGKVFDAVLTQSSALSSEILGLKSGIRADFKKVVGFASAATKKSFLKKLAKAESDAG